MTLQPLLVVGAGGFARETAEAVRALNADRPTWELLGFLDDDPGLLGREIAGGRVLGPCEAVDRFPDASTVICVGNPSEYTARSRIVRRLDLDPGRWATIVHPGAALASETEIGPGTVVLAGVVATAAVALGAHVAVMPGATLTHDDVVGDFATLGSGVRLGGGVRIDEGAYLGAGALVRERVRIGRWALVGMGAVVLSDVPEGEVWAGVPARRLRSGSVPDEFLHAGGAAATPLPAEGVS
jgi:sugar O-acyltransferase (sialic acid O-acetyltransferase NeuD family)